MANACAGRFGKAQRRDGGRMTDMPGPGNYKLPSEFGHYLSKHAMSKPEREKARANRRAIENSAKENSVP
jgi:hypothetical protein